MKIVLEKLKLNNSRYNTSGT